MLEVGRICMKIAGREAGNYCVIVKKIDDNFVMITGPKSVTGVKRRRCNINHLEPLLEKVGIKENASDEEVIEAYKKAKIFEKLKLPEPVEKKAKTKTKKKAKSQ